MSKEKILYTKKEILEHFSISSATLDNWVRTSIGAAFKEGLYDAQAVAKFVADKDKLNKRANKKKNAQLTLPRSLLNYLEDKSWVRHYLTYISHNRVEPEDIAELYRRRLDRADLEHLGGLAELVPHNDLYSYSVAYQALLASGDKSKSGAYYTPKFIVEEMVGSLVAESKTYLEPCCGVGFFTLEYIKAYYEKFAKYPHSLIYANDLDPIAAEITRLNILQYTKGAMSILVTSMDGLQLSYTDIDLIITNPPYGIKNSYGPMKTQEIYSHFIHKSLEDYLRPGGTLKFILPSSIMSVERHKEVRQYILGSHSLVSLKDYGKSFDGVLSDIVCLEIEKKTPCNQVVINGHKRISQQSLIDNDYTLAYIEDSEYQKIQAYYAIPHHTLSGATFALGIVTGDNKNFISREAKEGYVAVVSGKEVDKGQINYADCHYILLAPNRYQQKPPMNLFNKKKIVYKFISKKLVTAVDESGALTLNSANFFITDLPAEYVSAVLNSDALNEIYRVKFAGPLKVLKSALQILPIFRMPELERIIIDNYKNNLHEENNKIISDFLSQKILSAAL